MIYSDPRTFFLQSRRVVTPEGVRPAKILIGNGIGGGEVIAVTDYGKASDDGSPEFEVEDVGDLVIAPGAIDAHVHINDPGSDWEGFESATQAAAAGGVTTLVDMPLNSLPVTTTIAALRAKQEASKGKLWVNVGLYGGLVRGNADQLQALCEAGVLGVKCFLCHSGLDEFPNALEADLRQAMPILAKARVPLLVHAELLNSPAPTVTDPRSFAQFVASRPEKWELDALQLMIDLCRETGCQVHIVHLATGTALPMLAAAKKEGLPITVETCPHYLFFENSTIADGNTRFKCAPPIRGGAAAQLWQGLLDGVIDTIGSDHSPCPTEMKHLDTGDFTKAWGGIASLQLTLPAVWTFMKRHGCEDLAQLTKWLANEPAKLVGLEVRKGQIAAGMDADLVVWDPDARWQIEASELFHRHPVTPYDGCEVTGKVLRTYVRGQQVFREGQLLDRPLGKLLTPWWQGR